MSQSPLQLDRIPEPVQAPNTIRAAIADFLAAQEVGDVKPPPADLTRVKRLWWQAKQLFIFYWNGLKMVYTNFKRAQQLRLGVEDHGWKLNRREEVFLRRVDSDIVKLIPFVSVLLILEEVLPLLVLYAPWLLPSTCILPSQLLRIKTDEEKKRREGLSQLSATLDSTEIGPIGLSFKDLDKPRLQGICKAANLGTFAPQSILRRRLTQHLQ
jgi:LETM1 and EF-hand domain-containing protein 1